MLSLITEQPRVRAGTTTPTLPPGRYADGTTPRPRGRQRATLVLRDEGRDNPASAGTTRSVSAEPRATEEQPRVRGDDTS